MTTVHAGVNGGTICKSRYEKICEILECVGTPLDPLEFLQKLYHGTAEPLNYVLSAETILRTAKDGSPITKTGTYRSCRDDEELLELSRFRTDVYVPPQTFFYGHLQGKSIRNHHAIVLDLDDLSLAEVQTMVNHIKRGKILRPSMITASGGGLHLYYLFDKPYAGYHYRYDSVRRWKELLTKMIKSHKLGTIKMLSVTQPHRLPGSNTKKREQVRAFNSGPSYRVEDLVEQIGGVMPQRDASESNKSIGKTETTLQTQAKKELRKKIAYIPNGKAAFWDYCHKKLSREGGKEGNRERSLFALAIVGYKCRVPEQDVLDMVRSIYAEFNKKASYANGMLMDHSEVNKAMNGYQQKYVQTRAIVLANFFGWAWGENRIKRNGRTRKTHLEIIAKAKRDKSAAEVFGWIQTHPGGSRKACAEALGMSRNTVARCWK